MSEQLHHGGQLNAAARQWGIPIKDWLDLSTGINPVGWPVPDVPASVWQRLPEPDDGLAEQIARWAGAPVSAGCVPVSGTQAAIMALPTLRKTCRVGIPVPGYQEHGFWWQKHGHQVQPVSVEQMRDSEEDWLDDLDVLVCINPNNPEGQQFSRDQLERWYWRLTKRGGWLVVDEAFLTGQDNDSVAPLTGNAGLVVMRSLGKFFGLAGLRAGAVLADEPLAQALSDALGPWAVSGPARYLMGRALADEAWQRATAERLKHDSQRLHQLLIEAGLPESTGTSLFRYVETDHAATIADGLAAQAILVRRFDQPSALRFGLPGTESQWSQLEVALAYLTNDIDPDRSDC